MVWLAKSKPDDLCFLFLMTGQLAYAQTNALRQLHDPTMVIQNGPSTAALVFSPDEKS